MGTSLVVVLAHFLDRHKSCCVLLDLVDSSIAATEADRSLTCSITLEQFVVIARYPADFFQAIELNGGNPDRQIVHDVPR
jgi:hypothetical protein